MTFSDFIRDNLDTIIGEWETFARTLLPSARTMSDLALRDHCREMLLVIAEDMDTRQTDAQQASKAKGRAEPDELPDSAAVSHGTLRHLAGFDLAQVVAEFRAMRASVLALWHRSQADATGNSAIEEITRFNEAIDQALAESVESYSTDVAASRDMFLAILGHDLRGPLSAIEMSAVLLGKPNLTEARRQQALTRIRRSSRAMSRLITDLLDFTRSQLGSGIPIERSECELSSVCEEALDATRASYPERQFLEHLSGDLHAQADVPRMLQVLSNLLNNAVQHGNPHTPVSLRACGEKDAITLEVANFGDPIPADALQAIFEPLIQMQSSGSEPHGRSKTSLGLGLFIVREIVRGHEGDIAVRSTAESGTVFTIRLPRTIDGD